MSRLMQMGFGSNVSSLKERISLVKAFLIILFMFRNHSMSNLTAMAEAAMLELQRDGGVLCFTLVLFLRARNCIG